MSLNFEENVEEERIENPEKGTIRFCVPFVYSAPPVHPNYYEIGTIFRTTYNVYSTTWILKLTNYYFTCDLGLVCDKWDEKCHLSYKLYNELGSELYSSERISLTFDAEIDSHCTPEGAMKPYLNALTQGKLAKMVFLIEVQMSAKFFFHPFEMYWDGNKPCHDYPEDIDSNFRFEFLKDGDFIFKCPDGTVPALKMVMNVTPLKKYLNESNNDEFGIDHLADVVKPIITYIHSECFEMPTTYTLDFADRLLKALKFFELEDEDGFKRRIELSLCRKFLKDPLDFELILEWTSIAFRYSLDPLNEMVAATIAQKYYYQWLQRFPENTRTDENEMLENFFGSTDRALVLFKEIEEIFLWSSLINVIVP